MQGTLQALQMRQTRIQMGPVPRAVYELTALVAHIMGDAEEQERLKKKRERAEPGKAEGHIVAHIKASHPRHPPPPPPPPPDPTPAQTRDQLMVQGKTLELYMGAETPAAWHLRNWHFLYPLTIHEVLLVYGEYILCPYMHVRSDHSRLKQVKGCCSH